MNDVNNQPLKLAYEFIHFTAKNIFLTGKAGTGKTTFLHNLKKSSTKRMVITAPTGVAAINAGGVTLHSFFQMPFSPYIPVNYINNTLQKDGTEYEQGHWKLNKEKINIIKSLDLLVIDEISMVRADILDQVDSILRRYKDKNKFFGGIQLLMIGDIQQLAPVIKEDEWELIKNYYENVFFFSSKALKKAGFLCIELKHIFRQSDQVFINILNEIRQNSLSEHSMNILKNRFIKDFRPATSEGYITLTTHNAQAREINELELKKINDKIFTFDAVIEGQFPEYAYPTDHHLCLKPGAQVMFVKNDSSREKLYFNGKIAQVTRIEENSIFVKSAGDQAEIEVFTEKWQNMQYSINQDTKEIVETEIGSFIQFPLKLAWAITIHKSQGLTFEKAIIDANAAFAHGQVYVALSRCKSLDGLVLSSPLTSNGIISNAIVDKFSMEVESKQPDLNFLEISKREFDLGLLIELFGFKQILKKIFSGIKIIKELTFETKEEILANLETNVNKFKIEIDSVSEKFENQIKMMVSVNPDINLNTNLQERIMKGSFYFIEKNETIRDNLISQFQVETDNSQIKKTLKKYLEELVSLFQVKICCLEMGTKGFSTSKYLETRAKSAISTFKMPGTKKVQTEKSDIPLNSDLYNRLKSWRDKMSEKLNIAPYMIIQIKTMKSLAQLMPVSINHLSVIKGLGQNKIQKFGNEIVTIISDFVSKNKLETKINEHELSKAAENKKNKKDTKLLSLELYNSGKSIREIALQRKMTEITIENHLAYFIGKGELEPVNFVSSEKIPTIEKYFLQSGSTFLKPAKEALGDEYTYSELNFVLKHLQAKGLMPGKEN
ncbi:MAG: helix-turn-helix domain-containing protein [Bacteroidales bacterium]